MSSRAHFNRPVVDTAGNAVLGGEVMLYNTTGGYYAGEIYVNDVDPDTYTLPWTVADGVIDFWTDYPVVLNIGYRPPAQDETVFAGATVVNPDFYRLSYSFFREGPVAVTGASILQRYYVEEDMIIEWVRASVGDPPTGVDPIIIDVKVDEISSIWSSPANATTIYPDDYTGVAAPDQHFLVQAGSYLTFEVTQNGDVSPGEGLHIQVLMRRQDG